MIILSRKNLQKGAAVIEFAFVLPILLAFLVGVIFYGYVFMLDAAVGHAAKQGAQVAVNLDPVDYASPAAFESAVTAQVNNSVTNSLSWLPASTRANLTTPTNVTFGAPSNGGSGQVLTVTVELAIIGNSSPLLPQIVLPLPGAGSVAVPPLPPVLNGVAQVVL